MTLTPKQLKRIHANAEKMRKELVIAQNTPDKPKQIPRAKKHISFMDSSQKRDFVRLQKIAQRKKA